MKHPITQLFLLLAAFSLSPLLSAQSQYEAQFANPQINCTSGTFCINLQLRAAPGQPSFAIGAHTLFFSYNKNAINYPTYTSLHFNNIDSCALGGFFAPYFAPSYSFDATTGEFNLTTNMLLTNAGCPLVTTDWIDVGTVCFQIVGNGQSTQLQYNAALTLINLNDNTPEHIQGLLYPFNIMLDCSAFIDTDSDGLTDAEEATLGTNPNLPDSDFDGLLDGEEINTWQTNPLLFDTDNDGLTDGEEVLTYATNPLLPDTDEDGLSDYDEIDFYQTNPLLPDTDEDGLSDGDEISLYFTEPLLSDSDSDGLTDGQEINTYGTNPIDEDTDLDMLTDGEEINTWQTNPLLPDTDADGLTDADEVNNTNTNPNNYDTDLDGIGDGEELNLYDTNPLNPDTDNDTLLDGFEIALGLNPLSPDSDEDSVPDAVEVPGGIAIDTDADNIIDALDTDDDNDSILTINEDLNNNNNPTDDDTDADLIPNYLDNDDDNDGILTINEDTNNNNNLLDDDDDNDGIPDYLDADALSIAPNASHTAATLSIYPNPAANLLNLKLSGQANPQSIKIVLLNAAGEQVYQQSLAAGTTITQIPLHTLPSGTYILQAFSKESVYGTVKFMKQ